MCYLSQITLDWQLFAQVRKEVKSNVQNCFSAVGPHVTSQTRKILSSIHKDSVPITQQRFVVFTCAAVIVVT